MAAAYQNGTASSPMDLLWKLVAFLVSQGWTSNMSQSEGTGWRAHVSKGGIYANFRATPGSETILGYSTNYGTATQVGIAFYLGTGYSGASAWNAQAGGPIGTGQTYTVMPVMQTPSGSMTAYHFFDDGSDNIVVVVERTAGNFTNLVFGPSLNKAGVWTGGAYFASAMCGYYNSATASWPGVTLPAYCPFGYGDYMGGSNGFVRADIDSFTGKWLSCTSQSSAPQGNTGKRVASSVENNTSLVAEIPQCSSSFQARLTSAMNSQANLVPVRLYASRDAGGYSLLGDLPNIMLSNASLNGYESGSIYQIGAENWMIFPNFAVLRKA